MQSIIAAETSVIASSGHNAADSRLMYGSRPSEHMGRFERLFEQIKLYKLVPSIVSFPYIFYNSKKESIIIMPRESGERKALPT